MVIINKHNDIYQIQTLQDILCWGEREFVSAKIYFGHGTDNAWDEAVYLVRHVLNLPVDVGAEVLNRRLAVAEKKQILKLFLRRIKERKPAAYLTKEAWFAGLLFYVDERVLIPRSPLAELCENGFAPWIDATKVRRVLDICTGSGCISVACALAFPKAKIDAVDIAPESLEVAKINVEKYDLGAKVRLIRSDVFNAVPGEVYDIIISNPPYVAAYEFADLPPEYSHEPHLALAAGESGLDIIEKILKAANRHLSRQGILIVEAGNSEQMLVKRFPQVPFLWLEFKRGGGGVFLLDKKQLDFMVNSIG